MSVRLKPSTRDEQIQGAFGVTAAELYMTAVSPDASPALARALELRSFLALAEEHIARIRDRVYGAMAPDRDMGELSADALRFDAQWLDAALDVRDGYRAALGELLRTMPPPSQQPRSVHLPQSTVAATLPPSVATPAPQRARAARAHRP